VFSTKNFVDLLFGEIRKPFISTVEFLNGVQKITTNFLSSQLMNDNFYAFSYNKTLLDGNVEDLKDSRVKYIQVDSMNKCVPQDWFLGYDQFAVYTFLNLAG